MDSPGEILSLCRLCLVKDQVNIPIFDEQGDIRQIFLKISSCLPVTITRHDQLPKRICDACSNKLDLLYEFWNSSASAEKTLLSWLGQAGVKDAGEKISAVAQQIAKPAETLVKEESESLEDSHMINESQDSFEDQSLDEGTKDEAEAPPPKRARRTAAVKAQINITPESDEDEDDDFDAGEAMTKIEDESDESESELKDDPSYSEVPGTSADDQAGPSGVGKDGVEAPPQCHICFKIFASQGNLKRHSYIHSQEKKFQRFVCAICVLSFENNEKLQCHFQKLHRPSVGYEIRQCPFCSKSFKNQQKALKKHVWSEHDAQYEFSFQCSVCGKILTYQSSYIKHMETHDIDEPDYRKRRCVCETCGKEVLKKNIRPHMKVHLGVKPHKCDMCGKQFANRKILRHHIRTHTKEKPHKCPICFKGFTQPYTVTIHMRYHTGERPFSCCICNKGFVTKAELKNHNCKGPQLVDPMRIKIEGRVEGNS